MLAVARAAARAGGLQRALQGAGGTGLTCRVRGLTDQLVIPPSCAGLGPRQLSSSSSWGADHSSDFAPKFVAGASDVSSQIEKDIQGSKVFVYMKVWGAHSICACVCAQTQRA